MSRPGFHGDGRLNRGNSTLTAGRLRVECAPGWVLFGGRSLKEQTMLGKRLADLGGFPSEQAPGGGD